MLQSARYAPDLLLSSGAVAAYTEVAAPYIAQKELCKKKLNRLFISFQQVFNAVLICKVLDLSDSEPCGLASKTACSKPAFFS